MYVVIYFASPKNATLSPVNYVHMQLIHNFGVQLVQEVVWHSCSTGNIWLNGSTKPEMKVCVKY